MGAFPMFRRERWVELELDPRHHGTQAGVPSKPLRYLRNVSKTRSEGTKRKDIVAAFNPD